MQNWRDAELEGYRKVGIRDWRDSAIEEDWRDTGLEGYRKGGIRD